jgi:hypothetical protein
MVYSDAAREVMGRGLALLRAGGAFAAHECFETAWRDGDVEERALMRALAQLCAAYHQLAQGRAAAAVRTWSKARDKLACLDALSPAYERAVAAFWLRLGVASEAPRKIEVERLPAHHEWPYPDYLG